MTYLFVYLFVQGSNKCVVDWRPLYTTVAAVTPRRFKEYNAATANTANIRN